MTPILCATIMYFFAAHPVDGSTLKIEVEHPCGVSITGVDFERSDSPPAEERP